MENAFWFYRHYTVCLQCNYRPLRGGLRRNRSCCDVNRWLIDQCYVHYWYHHQFLISLLRFKDRWRSLQLETHHNLIHILWVILHWFSSFNPCWNPLSHIWIKSIIKVCFFSEISLNFKAWMNDQFLMSESKA